MSAFSFVGDGGMKRTIFATFLALLLFCTAIPVFAVPEYTDEQAKAEMEKELEEQGNTLGWYVKTAPNRWRAEGNMGPDDIAPRIIRRYHWGITQWYKVEYAMKSTNPDDFSASWEDKFYLDDDQQMYCVQLLPQSGTIQGSDAYTEGFFTRLFESPVKCDYLDMNVDININGGISEDHDYNPNNNHDEEYMLFWYITWQNNPPE